MPEGIEVKVLCEYLRKHYKDKIIINSKFISGRYIKHELPKGYNNFINNKYKIINIDNKGKFIYFILEDNNNNKWCIFNTLGLTGEWKLEEDKFTRFYFEFNDNTKLYFSDMRNFGTFKFLPDLSELNKKLNELGIDPFDTKLFTFENFNNKINKYQKKTLPEVLMNQKIFSGIGNYIKAESLYIAKLSPHRTIKSLNDNDKINLYNAIKYVMYNSYFNKNYYYNMLSNKTREINKKDLGINNIIEYEFKVYNRKEDINGYKVITEETKDKRTTYWVKEIQK